MTKLRVPFILSSSRGNNIFSSIFWNENPLALLSYFLESVLTFNDALSIDFSTYFYTVVLLYYYIVYSIASISLSFFITSLFFAVHPVVIQTLFWLDTAAVLLFSALFYVSF